MKKFSPTYLFTLFTSLIIGLICPATVIAGDPYSPIIDAQKNGHYPEALAQVGNLLRHNENDVQALLLKGNINKLMGNTDDAVIIFKSLIAQHPQMPEAYNNLAVLYADQGKEALAIETLQQVFDTQSSYATAYKNLRTLYNQMASSAYREALDIRQQPQKNSNEFALLNTIYPAPGVVPVEPGSERLPDKTTTAVATGVNLAAAVEPGAQNAITDIESDIASGSASAADEAGAETGIGAMIEHWSRAWSGRNTSDYFAVYHMDFVPPESLSRKNWEKVRGKRLLRPRFINIDIVGLAISLHSADTATAMFEQHYRSNTYSDTVVKQLTLKKHQGQWLIIKELAL